MTSYYLGWLTIESTNFALRQDSGVLSCENSNFIVLFKQQNHRHQLKSRD